MDENTPADTQERKTEEEDGNQPLPVCSGVIAFGLVSLPVSLFPANLGKPVSPSMEDEQGNPLCLRNLCERDSFVLKRAHIGRSCPRRKDPLVNINDGELESQAPEKPRDIKLRRFVPLDELNPVFFERGYFLAPNSEAVEGYRLFVKSMADEQLAGIATFVMWDREYLIAITAEEGILRAETLRLHDEIRSPQKVKKLRNLEDRKLPERKDVVKYDRPSDSTQDDKNVVDLMQVFKERLHVKDNTEPRASFPADIEQLNRDELYEEARKQNISGRSNMTRWELVRALKKAS